MEYIANIITSNTKNIFGAVYKICRDINDIDCSLPTLIIGFDDAKKYIRNFSIFKKIYKNQNVCWTYKKNEKRDEYENDVNSFCKQVILNTVKDVSYKYIDILSSDRKCIKKIIQYCKSNDEKTVLYLKGFVFVYSKKFKIVWGLSIDLCDFIGIKKKNIYRLINSNPKNKILDFKEISSYIKKIVGNDLHLILPLSNLEI